MTIEKNIEFMYDYNLIFNIYVVSLNRMLNKNFIIVTLFLVQRCLECATWNLQTDCGFSEVSVPLSDHSSKRLIFRGIVPFFVIGFMKI